ncbi:hypothetical protein IWZ01DRAFT_273410 [Phyllosticta capitalensis]
MVRDASQAKGDRQNGELLDENAGLLRLTAESENGVGVGAGLAVAGFILVVWLGGWLVWFGVEEALSLIDELESDVQKKPKGCPSTRFIYSRLWPCPKRSLQLPAATSLACSCLPVMSSHILPGRPHASSRLPGEGKRGVLGWLSVSRLSLPS